MDQEEAGNHKVARSRNRKRKGVPVQKILPLCLSCMFMVPQSLSDLRQWRGFHIIVNPVHSFVFSPFLNTCLFLVSCPPDSHVGMGIAWNQVYVH